MADMMQNDPNSALGQIQALLGNYGVSPDERRKAIEARDAAQQKYLGVLNEPMPDQGAISRMVNDYLVRYAKEPNRPAASMIAAIGAEGGRSQEVAQNQLLRRQLAAEQEAKMAGEALKEADLFGKGLAGLIGKTIPKPQNTAERVISRTNLSLNQLLEVAKDRFPNMTPEQLEQKAMELFKSRYNVNAEEAQAMLLAGQVPERLRGMFGDLTTPTPAAAGAGAAGAAGAVPPPAITQLPTDLAALPSNYKGRSASTPANFPVVSAEMQNSRNKDRLLALKQEWEREAADYAKFGPESEQGQKALRNQALIMNEIRLMTGRKDLGEVQPVPVQPTPQATPTVQPTPQATAQLTSTQTTKTGQPAAGFAPWTTFEPIDKARLVAPESKAMYGELEQAQKQVYSPEFAKKESALKSLRELANTAANINIETNKLTPIKTLTNEFAKAFGIKLTDASGKEITDYRVLEQVLMSTGLQMQLEQIGVQTDPDFMRNLAGAFSTTSDQKTRAEQIRKLVSRVNRQYGEMQFTKEALGGTNALGRVAEIPQRYRQMVNTTGLPESVGVKKGGKYQYVPINEAIEMYHSTSKGKEYAFDKNDSPQERQKKLDATIKAVKEMHNGVEYYFDNIDKINAAEKEKKNRGLVK